MTHRPENWTASPAQLEAFINQTALQPVVVLDAINDEVTARLSGEPLVAELYETLRHPDSCSYIEGRSALAFENNPEFRKKLLTADPRPVYFSFVRHWVAGLIKAKHPQLYRKLPTDFSNGLPA